MEKATKPLRSITCSVRFDNDEYTRLLRHFDQSTCQNLAVYIRSVALRKPIQIRYRNESLDEILEELADLRMKLRTILQHIGERPEARGTEEAAVQQTGSATGRIVEQELQPLVADIFERISKFSDIWSQYSRETKA